MSAAGHLGDGGHRGGDRGGPEDVVSQRQRTTGCLCSGWHLWYLLPNSVRAQNSDLPALADWCSGTAVTTPSFGICGRVDRVLCFVCKVFGKHGRVSQLQLLIRTQCSAYSSCPPPAPVRPF